MSTQKKEQQLRVQRQGLLCSHRHFIAATVAQNPS